MKSLKSEIRNTRISFRDEAGVCPLFHVITKIIAKQKGLGFGRTMMPKKKMEPYMIDQSTMWGQIIPEPTNCRSASTRPCIDTDLHMYGIAGQQIGTSYKTHTQSFKLAS